MPTARSKRSGLRERLGTYFLGVAIGCMMVLVLLMVRRAMLGPAPANAPGPQPPAAPATAR